MWMSGAAEVLPGWSPYRARKMDEELRKVDHARVAQWLRDLDLHGEVVFRASTAKVAWMAIGGWVFVLALCGALLSTDRQDWILFSDPSRQAEGIAQLVFGVLLLGGGLLLFGGAAVLATFIVPFASPRTIVTHQGVRYVWGADPRRRPVFHTQWRNVVAVRGIYTHYRLPIPATLHLRFYVRRAVVSVRRGRPNEERVAGEGQVLTGDVGWLTKDRRRDILAFLLEVHARSQRARRTW